jgi:hypothetical protein
VLHKSDVGPAHILSDDEAHMCSYGPILRRDFFIFLFSNNLFARLHPPSSILLPSLFLVFISIFGFYLSFSLVFLFFLFLSVVWLYNSAFATRSRIVAVVLASRLSRGLDLQPSLRTAHFLDRNIGLGHVMTNF